MVDFHTQDSVKDLLFAEGKKPHKKTKTLIKVDREGNISQHNKGHLLQTHSQHNTQWWKAESFLLNSGTRQGCLLSQFWKSQTQQSDKKNKRYPNQKRRGETVIFAHDMIFYTGNPRVSTPKLLKLINEFSKVAGYEINIHKMQNISIH